MLNIVMLCCMIVTHPPHKPKRECWITPTKLLVLQAAAVTADGITTRQYSERGFHELDPMVRPLIGYQPTYARMIPIGAAELVGAYLLARKYPKMRWLQLSFTVGHGAAAFHNSRL